jgi:hypothetical protein
MFGKGLNTKLFLKEEGPMTIAELKQQKIWFLWNISPGKGNKVTKVPMAASGGVTGTNDKYKDAESNQTLPVSEKYMLTIKEAAAYFNIGTKKMRRIAEDNLGNVAVYCGNRFLIIRPKFEEFILNSSEI